MKNLKLLSASLFLLFSISLLSCSKDKKIERTLQKKDGEWAISSVTWQKVIQDSNGQHVSLGTTANAGKFTFNNDGSGSYNFTIDGDNYSKKFTWAVNDEKISITKVSQTFDFSGNITQIAVAFSGTQKSKKSIFIEGSETIQNSSGSISQSVLSGSFSLSR